MSGTITYGIACTVINKKGEILILKRAPTKKLFPTKWFVVGAYPLSKTDDMKEIAEKELKDELGLDGKIIKKGEVYRKNQGSLTIEVSPFLAELNPGEIKLNNEHTEYKWIKPEELKDFDLVKGTERMVNGLL